MTTSVPAERSASSAAPGRLRAWILAHDDSRLFVIGYIGLAVVLSIWISLFWLVAVVAVHWVLEIIRHHHGHGRLSRALGEASWEIRLDIALVMFALALTLYMDVLLGLVGLQSAARLAAVSQAGSRVAAWERAIRGLVLSVDDAAQVARVAIGRRRRARRAPDAGDLAEDLGFARTEVESAIEPARAWSIGTALTVCLGVGSVGLIVAAPLLTEHTFASAIASLLPELHPLPR